MELVKNIHVKKLRTKLGSQVGQHDAWTCWPWRFIKEEERTAHFPAALSCSFPIFRKSQREAAWEGSEASLALSGGLRLQGQGTAGLGAYSMCKWLFQFGSHPCWLFKSIFWPFVSRSSHPTYSPGIRLHVAHWLYGEKKSRYASKHKKVLAMKRWHF